MAKVAAAVVEEVNAAGGVLGRKVQLVSEDDQTSPDAGVRAARKLIDVDKVSAIMGTWASAVTTAVAPLCWESKTFLCTVSGADSITLLPHQGYIIRTQPNSQLQVTTLAEFMLSLGVKKVFTMIPQTPFTQTTASGGPCTRTSRAPFARAKSRWRPSWASSISTLPSRVRGNS